MDIILYNGKIATMNSGREFVEAVAVKGNNFYKVGSNEEVLKFKTDQTRLINLLGKTVLPGFIDSHMHILSYAKSKRMVSLIDCKSSNDIIDKCKLFIGQNRNIDWLLGRGWNQDKFAEKKIFTRYDLDKISREIPICLTRACGHILVVNSKAIETIGINSETKQPGGGSFELDINGKPNGIFKETAMELIYVSIPEPGKEEVKDMILSAASDALKQGLTSIHSDDFDAFKGVDFEDIISAYKELEFENLLPIRINEQCLFFKLDDYKNFLNKGYKTGKGSEFFKIGPLKLLADGSLGGRTAYLEVTYTDDSTTTGIPIFTQKELDDFIMTAHENDMQVAVHCIGDGIMNMTFNSVEKALKKYPKSNHRHGIVHAQLTTEKIIKRFIENEVIAYIQPIFLDSDLHIVEDRIGVDRASTSYNYKTMIDSQIHCSFGSDCPVEPFNVFNGIYCAVTRKDLNGYPENGWLPKQKISVEDAVYAFTKEGAYASFDESKKGSIEEGMLADFLVVDRDIFEIPHDEIKDTKVGMTFVDGKQRY